MVFFGNFSHFLQETIKNLTGKIISRLSGNDSNPMKWLTSEGKNEDTDGDDPWHSAVALPKFVHYILKEDAQALDGPIGADLHQEEGYSHNPAPAAIRHLWVNIWTQAMKGLQHPHGYSRSPGGRHTGTISVFIVLSTWGQKNSVTDIDFYGKHSCCCCCCCKQLSWALWLN